MCILFVYRNPDADVGTYRLIVASNRDETYKRPASSAHYWEKHPECLGGTPKTKRDGYLKWYSLAVVAKVQIFTTDYIKKKSTVKVILN